MSVSGMRSLPPLYVYVGSSPAQCREGNFPLGPADVLRVSRPLMMPRTTVPSAARPGAWVVPATQTFAWNSFVRHTRRVVEERK